MRQRGAVKAASIASGLSIVIGVLVLPSLTGNVAAPGDEAECNRPGAISINALLIDPSRPDVTIELPQPIIAGTYSVTLVSFDDHSVNRPEQTEEQWFAQLLDADGRVVYKSDPTRDLPDDQDFLIDVFHQQPVTGTATQLQAVHRGVGASDNSIVALCALFTRVPAGRIIVEKVTQPADAHQRFAFTADYAAFELGDGEQHDSGPIPIGTHSVSEEAVPGWETTASCSDGSPPAAVDLQEDEIVTCTFTNAQFPVDLVVTVDDAPRGESPTEPIVTPGDPFDYVINVKNLGPDGTDNVVAVLTLSDEVVVDTDALNPTCAPAGTDQIVCSIGAVPLGEIIKVRVAVRVREDSPGIGTFVSSVIVGDENFPGERSEPNNRDEEPTTFPVAEVAGIGVEGRTEVPPSTGTDFRNLVAGLVALGLGLVILALTVRPALAVPWPERLETVNERLRMVLERRMARG